MISIDRSSGAGRGVLIALIVLVGAGAAWWWLASPSTSPVPAGGAASAASSAAWSAGQESTSSTDGVVSIESGESAPDTQALSQAMSSQPDGQQQLNRVMTFLKFQREFERWQEMQGEGDAAVRTSLGQKLLSQLPQHIAQTSMTLPEGEFMCGMVISDMEPNETVRDQKIQACQEDLKAVAPKTDTAQAIKQVDCEADYRSRETTLVAAFQALPSTQRDPSRLQADLDKAKQDVYNDPKCKP